MEVADDKLKEILSMANTSPSAGNLQARSVVIVKDKNTKEKISEAALNQSSIREAPVVLVVSASLNESVRKYGRRGRKLYAIQDATILAAYIQLAATSFGLSSVWVGAFNERDVQAILNLDNNMVPIALLPIGYAAEEPGETYRKSLERLVYKQV